MRWHCIQATEKSYIFAMINTRAILIAINFSLWGCSAVPMSANDPLPGINRAVQNPGLKFSVVATGNLANTSVYGDPVTELLASSDALEQAKQKYGLDYNTSDIPTENGNQYLLISSGQQGAGGKELEILNIDDSGYCVQPTLALWYQEVSIAVVTHIFVLASIPSTTKSVCPSNIIQADVKEKASVQRNPGADVSAPGV